MVTKHEPTVKRWIELPKSVADKIAEIAEREKRTIKAQTEVFVVEHVRQLDTLSQPRARRVHKNCAVPISAPQLAMLE